MIHSRVLRAGPTLEFHMTVHSHPSAFADRHIGARRQTDIDTMLKAIGYDSVDGLVDTAVPDSIRQQRPLNLGGALSEVEVLAELRRLASKNKTAVQMIGQGYYDTVTPPVIRRNILEAPAWYTAYTPYQPEISQGRLEALLNFQTMVQDLVGLPVANASLLDEATAVAEAVLLMRRANKAAGQNAGARDGKTVLDADCLPQTIAIVKGRAEALGFEVEVADLSKGLPEGVINGVVLQQPGVSGRVFDHTAVIADAKERGALVTVAADLLALTLITPPGEQGADIAVGSAQRFGVPLFFGGPHAAYMAVRQGMERTLPGRIVGVSKDSAGVPAYRLALQTREQHIRREKATSNICTAQALLAIVSSMYAVYHGPDGLKAIAETAHSHARWLAVSLQAAGIEVLHKSFFDTVTVSVPGKANQVIAAAAAKGINLRLIDNDLVGVSIDERTTTETMQAVMSSFSIVAAYGARLIGDAGSSTGSFGLDPAVERTSDYLQHPVFNTHRSETQLLRYIRRLSDRDLALDRTMIPLGSCTMKLNATAEMEAISWPEFASIHPFAPESQTAGWRELIEDLEAQLTEITGYDQVSIQPNAGSQGELAGLLAIRGYHLSRGDVQRNICLIPASAHGTNAASAVLAGMKVVVVATASDGTIDHADLTAKIELHKDALSCIMITYPSTHGVYDADVREVCDAVHAARRPGLHRRRQPQRPGRTGPAGHVRRRRLAPEPAQDLLHPARRRRTRRRPGRSQGAPGTVHAGQRGGPGQRRRRHPDLRLPLRLGRRPADLLGLREAHGRPRTHRGHQVGPAGGELHRGPPERLLPGALHGRGWPGGARVHPGPARTHGQDRRDRRGCGQAPDRLRLPRPHAGVPGGRHPDGGAHRIRGPGGDRPFH
ncbi:glycine dehydrogenase [Arthrobacter sp. MW3 TE3886]